MQKEERKNYKKIMKSVLYNLNYLFMNNKYNN